ncbi:hypothetical protein [Gilvibacter sp.]|uniref:hypothetical protein n=1 Tax=Gilvibacter sp. TaxID=2729997 RepID=UPI003F4A2161
MKRKAYIAAASLLESVIAISIIAGCLLVGLQVFQTVYGKRSTQDYYQQKYAESKTLAAVVLDSTTTQGSITPLIENEIGRLDEHQTTTAKGQPIATWRFKSIQP